jgi:hypothetical protein
MSRKNGDRARFDRARKARMHARERIRSLRKTLGVKPAGTLKSQ